MRTVSGLPVSSFYLKDGDQRLELIERKRASLKQAVQPIDGRLPAAIAFHGVIRKRSRPGTTTSSPRQTAACSSRPSISACPSR